MTIEELKRPLLLGALACAFLAVFLEIGAVLFAHAPFATPATAQGSSRPGFGIPYLAAIDALLLYSLTLMTVSLVSPREWVGRLQGAVGIVVSLILLIAAILMFIFALNLAILMITLLTAVPFGTIAYLIAFGTFHRDAAAAILSLVIVSKLVLAACLIFAQPRFLLNRSLVTLVLLSIGCTLMVGLLQGLPPIVLVSITDIVAAIVIAVVAILWALKLLFGSIGAVRKALA